MATERAVQFTWPYVDTKDGGIDGASGSGWYPANVRGINFDLENGATDTPGGWTGADTQVTSFPGISDLGIKEFTWGVVVADEDALAYVGSSKYPIYVPGGFPYPLNLRNVRSFKVTPSQADHNSDIDPISANFGLIVYFGNQELPPSVPSPYPLWYQRTVVTGADINLDKDNAAGTADSWHIPRIAPPFTQTPVDPGGNSNTITDANLFVGSQFTAAIRTSHLGLKTVSAHADGPIIIRVQGMLVKGDDIPKIIVDDPMTGQGVLMTSEHPFVGTTRAQYGMMRILMQQPPDAAVDNTVAVALEVSGRFGGGA